MLLIACLLVPACRSAGEGTTSAGNASVNTTSVPSQSELSEGSDPDGQPSLVSESVELGVGTFDLVDPRSGLAELSSYKQTLTVSFAGTKDGQPHEWSKVFVLLHNSDVPASVLTMDSSGNAVVPDPGVVAEAAGVFYESYRDGGCTGEPLDPDTSTIAMLEPASLISGLLGAEEAGVEAVDGNEARHYTFDERALAESGRSDSDGELWLAVEGGYLVSYRRFTTADAAYFGGAVAGTVTWEYDLTEINQLSEIEIPAGCRIDAPSMPDAMNVLALPRLMGFDTPSSVAEVTAYYQEQLPVQGWSLRDGPFAGEGADVAVYEKGDELLNVIVTTTETGTRVDIALSTTG